jgi:hypothetical protein
MSFSVSLGVRATREPSGVDRRSLSSFIDTLAVPPDKEIEIELLPDPGDAPDDRVLAVAIGGPGAAYERAIRLAFAIAIIWGGESSTMNAVAPPLRARDLIEPPLAAPRSRASHARGAIVDARVPQVSGRRSVD